MFVYCRNSHHVVKDNIPSLDDIVWFLDCLVLFMYIGCNGTCHFSLTENIKQERDNISIINESLDDQKILKTIDLNPFLFSWLMPFIAAFVLELYTKCWWKQLKMHCLHNFLIWQKSCCLALFHVNTYIWFPFKEWNIYLKWQIIEIIL